MGFTSGNKSSKEGREGYAVVSGSTFMVQGGLSMSNEIGYFNVTLSGIQNLLGADYEIKRITSVMVTTPYKGCILEIISSDGATNWRYKMITDIPNGTLQTSNYAQPIVSAFGTVK